jgi:hypothetical protein
VVGQTAAKGKGEDVSLTEKPQTHAYTIINNIY